MSVVEEEDMSLEEIIDGMISGDEVLQLEATHALREMLSKEGSLENTIIPKDIVLYCIEFLRFHHNPALQVEALWALTNVVAGTSKQTMVVVNNGAIPKLVELLRSPDVMVAEQAAWALGNIAGDGPETRDQVLEHNCMPLLLNLINTPDGPNSLIRNTAWAIANLFRYDPPASFEIIKTTLPVLNNLLTMKDSKILACASWALARLVSLGHREKYKIQAVVDSGAVPKLVALLTSPEIEVLFPALKAVGNIATGNETQTDVIINAGVLENLKKLLEHQHPNIVKDAAWALSNITAGTQQQIQRVIDTGIVPLVSKVAYEGDLNVKRHAALLTKNLFTRASSVQIEEITRQGAFPPSGIPLNAEDEATEEYTSLNCLMNGLSVAEKELEGEGMDHD